MLGNGFASGGGGVHWDGMGGRRSMELGGGLS